jgi:hypothetical protein
MVLSQNTRPEKLSSSNIIRFGSENLETPVPHERGGFPPKNSQLRQPYGPSSTDLGSLKILRKGRLSSIPPPL